jgi:hypothetical protein
MHYVSLDCRTMQFLALDMKRVRVLHVLTARNLRLFQCMHGRATRLWRQVTWSGYVVWLFCSAAWFFLSHMVHAWTEITSYTHLPNKPARHTIQAILVATPCSCFSFGRISWFGLHVTMFFFLHPFQQTTLLVSINKNTFAGCVIHPK